MTPADDAAFAELSRQIARGRGLRLLEAYKDKCLRRRIAVRMRACGVHSYADYRALLEPDAEEYERLLDALTINVTKFFRNCDTWRALAARGSPALCARARQPRLRVWSAGCSSGEEAYTLAILLREHARARRPHGRSSSGSAIEATDIDRAASSARAAAVYRRNRSPRLPPELRDA